MTNTTRRAPHMEKYINIHRYGKGQRYVVLTVNNQSFPIAGKWSRKEAEWMRDMLAIALDRLVANERS